MISVRNEWLECKTDEDRLKWANKWGDLLMEDFQNPIWVSGHTQGIREYTALLKKIKAGEEIDHAIPEELQEYQSALETLHKTLKVVTFTINVEKDTLPKVDEEVLLKVAADQMAGMLAQYTEIDAEELENGDVKFTYSLILVDG